MRKFVLIAAVCATLTGCATASDRWSAAKVAATDGFPVLVHDVLNDPTPAGAVIGGSKYLYGIAAAALGLAGYGAHKKRKKKKKAAAAAALAVKVP